MSYPQFDGSQACSNVDVNIFFAPDEDNPGVSSYREAKTLCDSCSWTLPCASYAIQHPELEGFWGGMSERERIAARRRLRRYRIA